MPHLLKSRSMDFPGPHHQDIHIGVQHYSKSLENQTLVILLFTELVCFSFPAPFSS